MRRQGPYGQRNATLILLMYRHGLRVAEVVRLQWDMLDLKAALLHVRRVKNGLAALHPLRGTELRALRQLQHTYPEMAYVFVSERGTPLTARTVYHIIAEAGRAASFSFPSIRICCGMPVAFTWPTKASIPVPCNSISAIGTSSIRSATLS